jgi:hypothetical protein
VANGDFGLRYGQSVPGAIAMSGFERFDAAHWKPQKKASLAPDFVFSGIARSSPAYKD